MQFKYLLAGVSLTCLISLPAIAASDLQPRAEIGMKAGTDRSLMTTEFWAPLAQEKNKVFYTDIRLMGDNDENREGNLGFGYREVNPYINSVIGGHLWIDRRRTQNNSTFHQVTFGAESLGHIIDLRANGYVPLNNSRALGSNSVTAPYLAGSGIFYDVNGFLVETPQYGADAEAGVRLPIFKKQMDTFRIYGGGYHFFRNNTDNVTGVRFRAEAQINKAVSVGARFQYDAERGSQGFLEATLKFPFSAKKLYQEDYLHARLDESPERDVDIVTSAKSTSSQKMIPVINTTTGQQQRVLYVDNTNSNAGDGTKDNPFNTLAAAQVALQANDVLYINHGDGTTTGMDHGLVIDKANVTLIGSGSNFIFDSGKFSAQNGADYTGILLKAAGLAPVISNTTIPFDTNDITTGNGILVTGENAYLTGVTVSEAAYVGIRGLADGENLGSFTVDNVTTNNNGSSGLVAQTQNGGIIDRVNFTNNKASGNQVIASTTGNGINITSNSGGLINTVFLYGNEATSNSSSGIAVSASGGDIGDVLSDNNTTIGNLVAGINFSASSSSINSVTALNSISRNNNSPNMYVATSTGGIVNSFTVDGALLEDSTSTSGLQINANSGLIDNITLKNIDTNNNALYGLYFNATNSGMISNINVEHVNSHDNTSSGIYMIANALSKIDEYRFSNITAENNGSHGLGMYVSSSGLIDNGTISNAQLNNNSSRGLYVYIVNSAGVVRNLTVSRSTIMGNTLNGIHLQKINAAGTINIDLGGGIYGGEGLNNISGNTGDDVSLAFTGGGNIIAKNNYWGGGDLTRITANSGSSIDASDYLTVVP